MTSTEDRPTFACPCCGYLSFSAPPGSFEICDICFWEDDLAQLLDPARAGGANAPSLVQAQANFAAHGWSEENAAAHVRAPTPADVRDARWRPLDRDAGDLERVEVARAGERVVIEKVCYWLRRDGRR